MAKFLGKDLSDEQLKSIVDFCSFDKLKKNPAFEMKIQKGLMTGDLPPEDSKKPAEMGEVKLFRKGEIGDWHNYFTDEMSAKIDEIVRTKLKYTKPLKFEPTVKKTSI